MSKKTNRECFTQDLKEDSQQSDSQDRWPKQTSNDTMPIVYCFGRQDPVSEMRQAILKNLEGKCIEILDEAPQGPFWFLKCQNMHMQPFLEALSPWMWKRLKQMKSQLHLGREQHFVPASLIVFHWRWALGPVDPVWSSRRQSRRSRSLWRTRAVEVQNMAPKGTQPSRVLASNAHTKPN